MLVVVSPFMGDIEAIVCGAAAHCEWEEYSDHSHIALYLLLLLLRLQLILHTGPNFSFTQVGWHIRNFTGGYTYVQESIDLKSVSNERMGASRYSPMLIVTSLRYQAKPVCIYCRCVYIAYMHIV